MSSQNFQPLAISTRHAFQGGRFTSSHKDPFDRLLAAQALEENLTLITGDKKWGGSAFRSYGKPQANSMITASTARLSPGFALSLDTVTSRPAFQHILHLHRLDHGERLARFHLLPLGNRYRNNKARHGAEQVSWRCRRAFFSGISAASSASRAV